MNKSPIRSAPVVSLLSPSPLASRRARAWFQKYTSFEPTPVSDSDCGDDRLDRTFRSTFLPSISWDSCEMKCASSGVQLHLLSIQSSKTDTDGYHELLALEHHADSIQDTRDRIAECFQEAGLYINMRYALGRPIRSEHLLGKSGLPIVDWSSPSSVLKDSSNMIPALGSLKEIVIPADKKATYPDGKSLLGKFAACDMRQSATGLYVLGPSLCLRPLPTASEDRHMSAPSLIFHVDHIESYSESKAYGSAKIGYNGYGKGQVMVRHPDVIGLDIRFCENKKRSSMFAEAQESLLAGSLEQLQSKHVLDGAKGELDPKMNQVDCWVEFRANIANPAGFLSNPRRLKVAKAPNIPFE
jgi:hypothetical protein|uniref:Uncharacterized protein n=1 Tax=Phaeodactylum tricornutum TaxID=2850 RepID=A0A8J9TEC1_PHATR